MPAMSAIDAGRRRFSDFDIASRAAFLSFSSNAVLMLLKLTVGLAFGSVAVLGDGVDSAEDLFASGLAFFTVRLSLQPADEAHPYGHGKAESLAAMSQAALIASGGIFIAAMALYRFINGGVDIRVGPSLVTMLIAAAANAGVAMYSLHAAKVSGSVAIAADARHLITNVAQAVAIVVALLVVAVTGNRIFDPIVALVLAVYLLWIALGIFRTALHELVDSALPDSTLDALDACLAHEHHGIRGYHALRTRKSGRETHIDLHALVDPDLSVSEAHRLVETLEDDIRSMIPGAVVTIHVDPDEPGIMERNPVPQAHTGDGLHLHRH
jgi:cation diffusion facilitator family transporter